MMSDFYRPDIADGVRFDDPAFGIQWPLQVTRIAERDRHYPDFERARYVRMLAQAVELAQRVSMVEDFAR